MCGVPHHSVTGYIQKLIAKGFIVAICDQVEDPSTAKGIVKREVTRVVTPALIADPEWVSEDRNYYVACITQTKEGAWEIACLDLLAQRLQHGTVLSQETLLSFFEEYQPKEILCADKKNLLSLNLPYDFNDTTFTDRAAYFETTALAALEKYLLETQKTDFFSLLESPGALFSKDYLRIDGTSLQSLEIIKSPSGHSLAETLDQTLTAMGRRKLKEWLCRPAIDPATIKGRLDFVEALYQNLTALDGLRQLLRPIRDLERLSTKVALGLANPRDLVAIRECLKLLPQIKEILAHLPGKFAKTTDKALQPLKDLTHELEQALLDTPPAVYREGGIFKENYHPELKELRLLTTEAKTQLAQMETEEKQRTGIASLKIKYNKVFGYTIEITKSHLSKTLPDDYIRKQTLAGGERYITEKLKNFEGKVLSADSRLKSLEENLFLELRLKVAREGKVLLENARKISEIDVLQSFAKNARENNYTRPHWNSENFLLLEEARHPVLEKILGPGKFISNTIHLDKNDKNTFIITGPNMGGKSTILRECALLSLMAHAGSFVPAKNANFPELDAIYTRIGSGDDLARGKSTFMVEMSEVARILDKATRSSLVLIDEMGRGTSTYDGLALAWSFLEYFHQKNSGFVLFATHFHELTGLEKSLPGVGNFHVGVEEQSGKILFTYRLTEGACPRSYGIEVAHKAGLPDVMLKRASQILRLLEAESLNREKVRQKLSHSHLLQMDFFSAQENSSGLSS